MSHGYRRSRRIATIRAVHRYHFQLFALDQRLELDPDTPLEELINVLKGHTLAKGEMVATYEAPSRQ